MALSFGCDPLPAVCLSQPITAKAKKKVVATMKYSLNLLIRVRLRFLRKKCCIKEKTMRVNPRKKCRLKKMRKKNVRKSCKKNAQSCKHGSTIIFKKDCYTRDVLGNVSHPEGETQSG